jgi:hypothetical protein
MQNNYNTDNSNEAELNLFHLWQNDWCLFAKDVLQVNLDKEQEKILREIQINPRVAIAAGTARGKDFLCAVAALCFLWLTPRFNENGILIENTKVALTAPSARQIENIMYPEVTRLYNNALLKYGRLKGTDIRTDYDEWFLTGFKADDTKTEVWSGFHAVNTMFIVTEASGISEMTFNSIEGNLQGNSRIVLAFNPNTSIGYAARAMTSPRWKSFRLDDLNATNVIQKKIIIPGQVDYEWVKDKVILWCDKIRKDEFNEGRGDFVWEKEYYKPKEGSLGDLFRVKVRGMFPEISEDILIPPLWIELAKERWVKTKQLGLIKSYPKKIGVDVAGMGIDSTVICERMGNFVLPFEVYQSAGKAEQMKIAGIVKNKLTGISASKNQAFIDTIGEGAGVYSSLVQSGLKNRAFSVKGSESAGGLHDITGIYEFVNMRTYLAWALRDWLNPINGFDACLPPDTGRLEHELTHIKYYILNSGKIKLEEGYEIKKVLGYSPDEFDALKSTFAPHGEVKRMNMGKLIGRLR